MLLLRFHTVEPWSQSQAMPRSTALSSDLARNGMELPSVNPIIALPALWQVVPILVSQSSPSQCQGPPHPPVVDPCLLIPASTPSSPSQRCGRSCPSSSPSTAAAAIALTASDVSYPPINEPSLLIPASIPSSPSQRCGRSCPSSSPSVAAAVIALPAPSVSYPPIVDPNLLIPASSPLLPPSVVEGCLSRPPSSYHYLAKPSLPPSRQSLSSQC
jgi:hypothetical protein